MPVIMCLGGHIDMAAGLGDSGTGIAAPSSMEGEPDAISSLFYANSRSELHYKAFHGRQAFTFPLLDCLL
jgi:hypothetical protein